MNRQFRSTDDFSYQEYEGKNAKNQQQKFDFNFFIDDLEDYNFTKNDLYASFDEKDEPIEENTNKEENIHTVDLQEEKSFLSINSYDSIIEANDVIKNRSQIIESEKFTYFDEKNTNMDHEKKKSLQKVITINSEIEKSSELELLNEQEYNERVIANLNNISCLYSSTNNYNIVLNGKFLLTTYRLLFLPYESNATSDVKKILKIGNQFELFKSSTSNSNIILIPLSFIYEINAGKIIKFYKKKYF